MKLLIDTQKLKKAFRRPIEITSARAGMIAFLRCSTKKKSVIVIVSLLILLSYVIPSNGQVPSPQTGKRIYTRYARVSYQSESLLRSFNKRIKPGSLDYLQKSGELSLESQVSKKIDIIVERVETILQMWPKHFTVDITIMPDAGSIRTLYRKKYHCKVNFLAFYAQAERTIYVPADDITSNILAHELAHAVIDQYYGWSRVVSVKIHERLADYVTVNFE